MRSCVRGGPLDQGDGERVGGDRQRAQDLGGPEPLHLGLVEQGQGPFARLVTGPFARPRPGHGPRARPGPG